MADITAKLKAWMTRSAARPYLAAGDNARDQRRWTEAAEAYRQYLALRPQDAGIWVQLGHALKESGFLDDAEAAYRKAIALDGAVADSYLQLGHALKLKGRRQDAGVAYARALSLDANNIYAREELVALGLDPAQAQAQTAAPASAAPADKVGALESQMRLMGSQLRAVRVLGGEVLKTRREAERLAARVATLESENAALRAELDARLTAVEARLARGERGGESVLAPFPKLVEYVTAARAAQQG